MNTADVRTLVAFNRGSNARILDATARGADERFHAPGPQPPTDGV